MASRVLFGGLLLLIGIMYLWLAYESVKPQIQKGDIAAYVMAVFFLVAGIGAAAAGINLVRAKRR
ncbi:MAG TPA: hypothetical protein VJ183_12200 [Chloroflexia bacterium]|nr:hypothetical protein [Chloroflexia bacterium]